MSTARDMSDDIVAEPGTKYTSAFDAGYAAGTAYKEGYEAAWKEKGIQEGYEAALVAYREEAYVLELEMKAKAANAAYDREITAHSAAKKAYDDGWAKREEAAWEAREAAKAARQAREEK